VRGLQTKKSWETLLMEKSSKKEQLNPKKLFTSSGFDIPEIYLSL